MAGPWLTVVGLGEDGHLAPAAISRIKDSAIVYGGERHFSILEAAGVVLAGERRPWPSPFSDALAELLARRGTPVAVLATGDPQWFGIGATLARRVEADELAVFPAPSAFSLAAARLGWALQEVETLSLHGRPVEPLRACLAPGARILALTGDGSAPAAAARLLVEAGCGASRMTVLEHMGGPRERVVSGTAADWRAEVADFHTLAVEVVPDAGTVLPARVPGLPDAAFRHDGKMTKREVRAVTLAALAPHPGALLWDIGAGCGSVAIEWLRAARGARAVGLEPHAGRRALAAANAAALGVPQLDLQDASAPDGLAGLPDPDAIFIGGGLTAPGVVETCHRRLKPGGRLVANAVTLEGEAVLSDAWRRFGGELVRLAVQRADAVGGLTGWRPLMPVTQWSLVKR
ncbi:bifunctional cobalt-precorrin-7 (C(5))-methyltransferase/cobalt-precorrin-6B (C(15))-methyltransferase [Polymorphum gilvum]|uniref:Precorrin-6y C5,15-methyltransferase, CbiE subunit domain protein n=1 Tax=Polymorphum gilvum (strain LMG 25793 / CGMCC 1.9160 / SL003B-26A1) TaxID=991905 RepID=F2J5F1_POLGS|nr:Precorrin-6y C5,15-methyltransferase, CbiE subunit domain protein [Polymorphum gilvum SL003B-26A1]